jgi:hypothetical protein
VNVVIWGAVGKGTLIWVRCKTPKLDAEQDVGLRLWLKSHGFHSFIVRGELMVPIGVSGVHGAGGRREMVSKVHGSGNPMITVSKVWKTYDC